MKKLGDKSKIPSNAVGVVNEDDKVISETEAPLETDDEKTDEFGIPRRAQKNRLYKLCFNICTHSWFDTIMILCILFNSVILAMDQHPLTVDDAIYLENINEVLSWIFFTEMIIKLTGLGPTRYVKDSFNIFDAVVVIISVIELIVKYAGVPTSGGAFSGLRAIRLLRVFKLAKSWKSFG